MATSIGSGLTEDCWETVNTKIKKLKPQSSESVSANKFALLPPRLPPNPSVSNKATNQRHSSASKNYNEVTKERATANILKKEQTYAHLNQTSNASVAMNTIREMPTGSVKKTAASIGVTTKIEKNPSLTESSRVWLPTATYQTKSNKIPRATVVPPAVPPAQRRIPQVPGQIFPVTTVAVVPPAQAVTKGVYTYIYIYIIYIYIYI
jgi:copper chaperone CopZ